MFTIKDFPKISCLLVTAAGRQKLAYKSIECYLRQTYPNKELLVINEGPSSYQKDLQLHIDNLDRPDIRTIWLNGKYTLGALRNISVYLCEGDYFVQWDDDDFCLPQRLASQYSFLSKNPKAIVCYLSDQLHYFWSTKTLYWNNWRRWHSGNLKKYSLIPGTGMYRKSQMIWRYPSCGDESVAGEDSVFANKILLDNSENVVLLENMGNMHCYTHHGNQVYDIEHHMNIARMRSQERIFLIKNRERIIDSLRYFQFPGPIKVMGREGLAFTYSETNV